MSSSPALRYDCKSSKEICRLVIIWWKRSLPFKAEGALPITQEQGCRRRNQPNVFADEPPGSIWVEIKMNDDLEVFAMNELYFTRKHMW